MRPPRRCTRLKFYSWALLCASLAWGLVELLALQRSRYLIWRARD